MGTIRFLLVCAVGLLLTSSAAAQVTEPNGLVVPQDSSPEEQLYTLFMDRGEAINWITDAHVTPATFSPLCSFQATFVLNQAGSHFGAAWYNATGGMPPASDLHVILPPGSPVGTVISSMSIRSDPAYMGGLIGFALMGGQIHYSETNWNPICTGCSPPAAWQMALIYASTVTPNAYYVGFEDGNVGSGPGDFSNDGDFNDDVFFFEGITCSGGGMPCMTTMPGVCANGVEQCAAGGVLSCVSVITPSAETCNGLDDDCNGMTDEGDLCPTDFVCDRGTCVHRCDSSEFGCDPALVCDADGFCVDPSCAAVTCPAGSVCHGGMCRAPCDGVTCPMPLVCRVDRCVDPCDGVMCGAGQVCNAGVCQDVCTCAPCATGLACDTPSGLCRDPACSAVVCDPGTICISGTCVDACTGAVCPPGEICMTGACVPAPPTPDAGTTDIDAGSGTDGGSSSGGDGGHADSGTHSHTTTSGGCCSVAAGARGEGALFAFAALGLAVLLRRRFSST